MKINQMSSRNNQESIPLFVSAGPKLNRKKAIPALKLIFSLHHPSPSTILIIILIY